jgi:acyl-CoA synthetase (AMP-forming)/AMP-acid ligase II
VNASDALQSSDLFDLGVYLTHLKDSAFERATVNVYNALVAAGSGPVLLACKGLDSFAAGLFGAWVAGRVVELPPNGNRETIEALQAESRFATVVHDLEGSPGVFVASPDETLLPEQLAPYREASRRRVEPERILLVVHTSGTISVPKRVEKSAQSLLGEVSALAKLFGAATAAASREAEDAATDQGPGGSAGMFQLKGPFLATVSPFQLYGLLFAVLLPMRMQYAVIPEAPLFADDVVSVLQKHNARTLITTPAHLAALRDAALPAGLMVVSSGARLDGALQLELAMRRQVGIIDVLGSSETGGLAVRRAPGSPWTPLPGVLISVRDDDQMNVSSAWTSCRETKDRVSLLEDGRFQLLGRADDVVKVAGKRVDLGALVEVARRVPGVSDAAVIAEPNTARGVRLALAIAPAKAPVEQVRTELRAMFDAVVLPRPVLACSAIPRTDRGKVDRAALRALVGFVDPEVSREFAVEATEDPLCFRVSFPRSLVFFEGHFEDFPILPAVAPLTTLVAPLIKQLFPELGACTRISRARFRKPILPGQAGVVRFKRFGQVVSYELVVDSVLAASANLHFVDGSENPSD